MIGVFVVGHNHLVEYDLRITACVGINNEIAVFIVATRGTYSVHEILVILTDSLIATIASRRCYPTIVRVGVENLVEGFEKQMIIVIAEGICNLGPQA